MNPILQMLNKNNNPMSILNNMSMQNPQMQQVINLVNQNGGNPKEVFYAMAKQKGIDPNQILNMLK